MRRRGLLAAAGAAIGATAGCSAVTGTTNLRGETEIDERWAAIHFREDGETVFRLQLMRQYSGEQPRAFYPFSITTWQRDGIQLDSLSLSFRAPPYASAVTGPGIYLREDAHADRATITQDDTIPVTTTVAISDTSEIGSGTVRVNLLLEGDGDPEGQELHVRVDAELSSSGVLGAEYSAHDEVRPTFP